MAMITLLTFAKHKKEIYMHLCQRENALSLTLSLSLSLSIYLSLSLS